MSRLTDLTVLAADNMDGSEWYPKAQAEIAEICRAENWHSEYFTGILAVTSPRVSVRRNIRIALNYMTHGKLLANVIRSVRRSVEVYNETRLIKGRKTEPFYRALCGDGSAIVLDTHMANLFRVPQKLFALKHSVNYYSGIIAGIARELRIGRASCQACLWYGHRRNQGEMPGPFPILAEYHNWLAHGRMFADVGAIETLDDRQLKFFDGVADSEYAAA